MNKYIDLTGLSRFLAKLKELFPIIRKNGGIIINSEDHTRAAKNAISFSKTTAGSSYGNPRGCEEITDVQLSDGYYEITLRSPISPMGGPYEYVYDISKGENYHIINWIEPKRTFRIEEGSVTLEPQEGDLLCFIGSIGYNSFTLGRNTVAAGGDSIATGYGTQALNNDEISKGSYNKSNKNSESPYPHTLESLGIGTSNNDRKNAYEVLSTGDIYIKGFGGYDGTNPFEEGVHKLQEAVLGDGITTIKKMSQNDYDNLETKDPNTLYVIV